MSRQGFMSEHWLDDGKPSGGVVSGCGFTISWQNGPLGRGSDRKAPNGAFVEDVIAAVIDRLEHYQVGPYGCIENDNAISYLQGAVHRLNDRTRDREKRGVEGTHAL